MSQSKITRNIVKKKFTTFITYLNDNPQFTNTLPNLTRQHIKLLRAGWILKDDTLDIEYYAALKEHHAYITEHCKDVGQWMDYLKTFMEFRICFTHGNINSPSIVVQNLKRSHIVEPNNINTNV